ncbi:uncharacterized protein K02A2.6-like, partial [Stomoxys calcitrans]|uniref:uncharacterized protein K02A2.6-like n=1 Tax=Stomoxys calcitrans TaxID=35570 RepID=UPI0027E2772F
MDFLGPYPRSRNGNIGIFVVLDHFTKYPFVRPIRKFTAGEIYEFLETQIFNTFGVPEFVVTDNGSQFKSILFSNLMSKYGIKHIFTAVYSPQSNSAERLNRSILAGIRSYLKCDQRDWDNHLGDMAVALRSMVHTSIGFSPFYVLFGNQMVTHAKSYDLLRNLGNLEIEAYAALSEW